MTIHLRSRQLGWRTHGANQLPRGLGRVLKLKIGFVVVAMTLAALFFSYAVVSSLGFVAGARDAFRSRL
jgi:hypothetical protein